MSFILMSFDSNLVQLLTALYMLVTYILPYFSQLLLPGSLPTQGLQNPQIRLSTSVIYMRLTNIIVNQILTCDT